MSGERECEEQANAALRKVTPEMLDSLRATYENMSLPLAVDWGEDANVDYKELLAQALERDYKRLD